MTIDEIEIGGEYVWCGRRVRVIKDLNIASATGLTTMREARKPGHALPATGDEDWKVEIMVLDSEQRESVKVGELSPVPE